MTRSQFEATSHLITIAIPTADGRLHGHFGGCEQFTFVQADVEQRKIVSVQPVTAPPHAPGLFPRWLHEHGASVVIAGGIGRRALANFVHHGITVLAGIPDTPVEELVTAYLNGGLTATPEGCEHHGYHHHGHHHHHHGHHHPHEHGDASEHVH